MKKVLIGCPTFEGYEYCLQAFASRITTLTYSNYEVLIADNSATDVYTKKIQSFGINTISTPHHPDVKQRIVASRNALRAAFLAGDYDYFLSIEQDIIPPYNVIEQLIRHEQDAVSGIYYKIYKVKAQDKAGNIRIVNTLLPVVFTFADTEEKMNKCYPKEVEGSKFFRIRAAGLGCMMISRKALEAIPFKHIPGQDTFDDFLFCGDLYAHGFTLYTDTTVKCKHLFLKKGNVFKQ